MLTHVGARREERPGAGTSLADRISALDGRKAICALEFVLCVTGEQADPGALQEMEPRLIEALAQRGLRELATPDPAATPGSLACVALEHLAARNKDTRDKLWFAIALGWNGQRDPESNTVGVLALLAFGPDIGLHHEPGTGWVLRLPADPAGKAAAARLLAQLLGLYRV